MGIKSSRVSARWPRMAIVGCMQDDDCSAIHDDGGGLRDGTGSRSRSGLLRDGGLGVERLAVDAAPDHEGVPVVLSVREGSPGGSYGAATKGHVLCPATFPAEVRFPRRAAGRRRLNREASDP